MKSHTINNFSQQSFIAKINGLVCKLVENAKCSTGNEGII